jgi:hypothetical protein
MYKDTFSGQLAPIGISVMLWHHFDPEIQDDCHTLGVIMSLEWDGEMLYCLAYMQMHSHNNS